MSMRVTQADRRIAAIGLVVLLVVGLFAAVRPDLPPATDLGSVMPRIAAGQAQQIDINDTRLIVRFRDGSTTRVEGISGGDAEQILEAWRASGVAADISHSPGGT